MGRPPQDEDFGPLEAEVMRVVWRAPEAITVREALEELNRDRPAPLAYTTVMTVMGRLAAKRRLSRRKVGRSHLYEASAADPAGIAVQDLLHEHGDAAIAQFVEEARGDPEVMRRLRRLLSEADG
jgi:predicted transcriptional regulator